MPKELTERKTMKISIGESGLQFCSFYIEDQLFGVNILMVKEIIEDFSFTKIYHTPKKVKGYVNVRGNIYLILDMRVILGYSAKDEIDDSGRIILFKSSVGEDFGILIEKIEDIINVQEIDLENVVNLNKDDASSVISTTCKLNNNLMTIINPIAIIEDLEKSKIAYLQEQNKNTNKK